MYKNFPGYCPSVLQKHFCIMFRSHCVSKFNTVSCCGLVSCGAVYRSDMDTNNLQDSAAEVRGVPLKR
jgi:hypothetical protein